MQVVNSVPTTTSSQVVLHGVGISVVNALSSRVEAEVQRQGNLYQMAFEQGEPTAPLVVLEGKVSKRATGNHVHFGLKPNILIHRNLPKALKHNLKAKAVFGGRFTKSIMSTKSMTKKNRLAV